MRKREGIYKRILALVIAVILCSSNMSWEVFAANREGENSKPATRAADLVIPDPSMRASLWNLLDGSVDKTDPIPVTRIEELKLKTGVFRPHDWTYDITGIQYLTNISEVDLSGLSIPNIDFPRMDNVKKVFCNGASAETLYVGKLKNLEVLDCSNNYIRTLDLTKNPKLKTLTAKEGYLFKLNLGDKPDLSSLDVSYNSLISLDLEKAPLLKEAGAKLEFNDQGTNYDSGNLIQIVVVDKGADKWYLDLDMAKLLGNENVQKIKNFVAPTLVPGTSGVYNEDTGMFSLNFDDWDSNNYVLQYEYQVFGDNSIKMPVSIRFDTGQAIKIQFRYLDSDGITWKFSPEYTSSDSGFSVADKAPTVPKTDGYDFVGWDRSIDYVTKSGTISAVYEEPQIPHTVTFKDYDGTILEEQVVLHGKDAVAPTVPTHEGMAFFKWDNSMENITSDGIVITAIYSMSKFSDNVFRKYVWEKVLNKRPDPYDSTLTDLHNIYTKDLVEIEKYDTTNPLPLKNVSSIDGIEYFKGLTHLQIYGEDSNNNSNAISIKKIDLTKNKNLEYLQLTEFPLEELSIGKNENLQIIRINDTKLKGLDVSGCELGFMGILNDLGDLQLYNNDLKTLTLGNQPEILTVFVDNNPNLKEIDVTGCPKLDKLTASNTGLTGINVTKNLVLRTLDVSYNHLTTLNVKQNTELQTLALTGGTPEGTTMWGNKVKKLDLENNTKLITLQCETNGIEVLDLSKNLNIRNVHCQKNEITNLDMRLSKELRILNCYANKLNDLNLSENTKLYKLECFGNPSISTLDLSKNLQLEHLSCGTMNLQTLDLSVHEKLQFLSCSDNLLYQLDLHPNAFNQSATLSQGITRGVNINPQKPRAIYPLINETSGNFEYDLKSIFGSSVLTPGPMDKVTFGTDLADQGTYNNTTKRIVFDKYDAPKPFTYQYSTGNNVTVGTQSAENLNVMLTPNFGTFFTVKYHDGDKQLLEVEAPENGKLTKPTSIPGKKTGYEFNGWYKDQAFITPWDFAADTVTADSDLYAKWTQSEYKVIFDSVGAGEIPSQKLHYDDLVGKPSDVTIAGKTFSGWYRESNYQNLWDFETEKLEGNMTLYARWSDNNYTVKYDTGSVDVTSIPDKLQVHWQDAPLLPAEPVRTGYDFAGWKCGETDVKEATKYKDLVADDTVESITLNAQWKAHTFTVNYDTKFSDVTVGPKTNVTWDQADLLPEAPVKAGQTFIGWKSNGNVLTSETKYKELTTEAADGTEITLDADWTAKKYVVNYVTNSPETPTIAAKPNVLYEDDSLLPAAPVRTGYDFAGWKCGETPVTAATKYKELVADDTVGSMTLEAQWTAHHFTVNYDTKFADVTVGPKTNVTWDEANLLPEAPVKAGQTFNGWKSNGNVLTSETKYKELTTEAADGTEITLDADWTAKKYVVNYVTNSPETPTIAVKQNVLYEDASLLPPDPVRTGYDFAGWKCGETPVTAATKYKELAADDTVGSIALEAQWTAHHFSISYDSNGGSPVSNKTNVIWEDAGLLPENNPARPGFGFNGWYLNGNEVTSDKQYKDLTSVDTDATSITFTADWIELTDYSVQYAPEGGNMPDGTDLVVTNMKYADEISLPTPIRPGFTFDGWEFDKTIVGGGSKYSDLEADDTIKLITLTASWTEREDYSVTYAMDGGVMPEGNPTQTDNMKYSDIVNTPIPIKPGFSFGGWTYKNVPVAAGSKYSALEVDDAVNSLTLAANWTKMQDYSVEYLLNGGTMPNGEPTLIEGMAFADRIPTPAPIRTGFTFNGWMYNGTLVAEDSLYSGNAANDTVKKMSLSASWTEREDYSVTYVMNGGVMPGGKPAQIDNMKYSDIVETPVPVKPGFLFKGWTYKNKPVADAQTYETLVQDDSITQIELAAVWQIRTDYGISYTLDGGQMPDGVPDKIENLKFADVVQTPKPVRKGFTFEGWKYGLMTISDGILYGAVAEDDTVTTLVLTAQWKANHYTVKYETGVEGIAVEDKTDVTWDQAGLLPLNLKRPGYGIKNWSMGEKTVSAETKYSDLALDDMEGTSILLTVKWMELEDYSIIYDVDGGTMPAGTDLSETGLKYAGKVSLPEPTKTGHTFQHWSYQNTKVKAGSKYSDLTKNDEIKTLELKAVWKADTYKVSYAFVGDVPNGMQTPEDITVDYGSKVSAPTIKEQKGWTFSGWYTDKDCTKQYNFNTLISGDLKLYGKWSYSGKTQIPGGEGGIGNTSSVPTGDTNNLALLFALSLLSGIMVIVLVRKRKKNNAKDFRENA